jgi:hypothetical protein
MKYVKYHCKYSYFGCCKACSWVLYMNTYQNAPVFLPKCPHYFFRTKIVLPKRPHFFLLPKRHIKFFYLLKRYHVWYLVIQDLSSKFIYCIYMFILHQTTTNLYIYAQVIVSYPFVFGYYFFCDNKI